MTHRLLAPALCALMGAALLGSPALADEHGHHRHWEHHRHWGHHGHVHAHRPYYHRAYEYEPGGYYSYYTPPPLYAEPPPPSFGLNLVFPFRFR